jgi:hypothetical protein
VGGDYSKRELGREAPASLFLSPLPGWGIRMKRGAIELALGRALKATPITTGDAAAVALARRLAAALDGGELNWGRQFLETLTALGMTPKARAGVLGVNPAASDPLDELWARRASRGS